MRGTGRRVSLMIVAALVAAIGPGGCRAQGVPIALGSGSAESGDMGSGRGPTVAVSHSRTGADDAVNSAPSARPLGIPGAWRPVFDDEFTGAGLDPAHWSTGWLGNGITPGVSDLEENCDDPAQVAVAGGTLQLSIVQKAEQCGGVTQPYAAGAVNSDGKASFLFGAFEARIYLPAVRGYIADWPAWWADGQTWPVDGEMDVMEGLSGVACYHLRYSASHSDGSCAAGDFTGWHTYGADWEPGSVTYYYDGVEVGQITNSGITPAPQFLVLNYSVHRGSKFSAAPMTMRVDYVRVWQH